MIFQCKDLERALRSPELMPDARAHAETCERCRQELYLWSEISRVAPQLHQEWESPGLWTRIEAEMVASGRTRKVIPIWRWAAAAAAIIVMAAVLLQPWKPVRRPQNRDFLTEETLRQVQQAEAAYAQSIDRLSKVAGAGLEQSPTPLAAAYREKLTVLDSAIADLKANIAANRYNVYLQNQLASLYREKQNTLQEWLQNAKRN
jgi:hypothetical protein